MESKAMAVTYHANVYVSADEFDEEDVYVNSTVPTVEKHKPTSDKKRPFIIPDAVRPFLPLAVCWVMLLIILFLRIHFTSVISAKMNQNLQEVISLNENWKQDRDDLNVQVYNMRDENDQLKRKNQNVRAEKQSMSEEVQRLKAEKQSMSEEVQRLKAEKQSMSEEVQRLKAEKQSMSEEVQRLKAEKQSMSEEVQRLKAEKQSMSEEVQRLKAEKQSMSEEVQRLKAEKQSMSEEVQRLKAEKQSMSEEVQRLKAENQRLKKTYEYTTAIPTVTMWNTTSDTTAFNSSISWMWMSHCRRRRQIEPCQKGWLQFKSSCYVTSNHDSLDQKTWEGARDDCRGRNSELVVIESPEEQDFVYSSLIRLGVSDYWIGLRVKGGSWNWVDGRDLTDHYWIQQPADNEGCVVSVRGSSGWKAVRCDIKNSWICEQGALAG